MNTVFILVVCILIVLACYMLKTYRSPGKRSLDVPGPQPSSNVDGNLPDIAAAGSLHQYLMKLHREFGPIASFLMGSTPVVTIASPELFKEHQHIFDRPPLLFKMFEPFIGPKSIQYANGADGSNRRNYYDKAFAHEKMRKYYSKFQEMTEELVNKWSVLPPGEHIPLNTSMATFVLKIVLTVLFGDHFHQEMELLTFSKAYDVCWGEMEKRLAIVCPSDSERQKEFDRSLTKLKEFVHSAVEHNRQNVCDEDEKILLDLILEHSPTEEQIFSDSLTYVVGGFHTAGNLMTWGLYYLAKYPTIQQKVYEEIKKVLRDDEGVNATNAGDLQYMMQVLQETIRCAVIAPWAARYQVVDSQLGGYHIPKNTPVIQALGVMEHDEKYWPEPEKFDPDRFSPEQVKSRPSLAFMPFGFAGKRICPAYKFSYAETSVLFAALLRKFEVQPAVVQTITPIHGLVTHPSEEIWITLHRR